MIPARLRVIYEAWNRAVAVTNLWLCEDLVQFSVSRECTPDSSSYNTVYNRTAHNVIEIAVTKV